MHTGAGASPATEYHRTLITFDEGESNPSPVLHGYLVYGQQRLFSLVNTNEFRLPTDYMQGPFTWSAGPRQELVGTLTAISWKGTLWSDNGNANERFCYYSKSPPSYFKEEKLGWSWREGTASEFRPRSEKSSPCRFSSHVNKNLDYFTSKLCRDGNEIYKLV